MDKEICDECYDCLWYWQNRDYSVCEGESQKCCEYVLDPYSDKYEKLKEGKEE